MQLHDPSRAALGLAQTETKAKTKARGGLPTRLPRACRYSSLIRRAKPASHIAPVADITASAPASRYAR